MELNEYINTVNYRQRITSLLCEEAKRLSPKQFLQFSIPFQQELDRLEGEIAFYEVLSTPTLVAHNVNCGSFTRLVQPHVKPTANIWLHGSLHVAHRGEAGKYVLSDRLLYQDTWEGPNLLSCPQTA
jgi:hypothetical protein